MNDTFDQRNWVPVIVEDFELDPNENFHDQSKETLVTYLELAKNILNTYKPNLHKYNQLFENAKNLQLRQDDQLERTEVSLNQSMIERITLKEMNQKLSSEVEILKKPVSKNIESLLANIHNMVLTLLTGNNKDPDQTMENIDRDAQIEYEKVMSAAEINLRLVENQLGNEKNINLQNSIKLKELTIENKILSNKCMI